MNSTRNWSWLYKVRTFKLAKGDLFAQYSPVLMVHVQFMYYWLWFDTCMMQCFLWLIQKWTADSTQPRKHSSWEGGVWAQASTQPLGTTSMLGRYVGIIVLLPFIRSHHCSCCHSYWLLPVSKCKVVHPPVLSIVIDAHSVLLIKPLVCHYLVTPWNPQLLCLQPQ